MIKSESGSEARARVLALMVAANGRIDPRELQALEELGAYERIGVPRERFVALARECLHDVGAGLAECSWLRARDQAYVDRLLDAITDPHERLVLCRLAAAAVTADGQVSGDERLVYDHVLARWHVSRDMVTQAILQHVERGA
ncbi:MAG TPA: hypothetical protein VLE94_09105 [Burkholderiaceae bacterium]|nr:hypothetical protein [Burkholderiaceae bacterium]